MKRVQLLLKNKHLILIVVICLLLSCLAGFLIFIFISTPTSVKDRARLMVDKCIKNSKEEQCFANEFASLTQQFPLRYSLATLAEIQKSHTVQKGCHFIAHVIATEQVIKNNGDWEKTITQLPVNDCTGGFVMGTLEGAHYFDKKVILDAQTIPHICRKLTTRTTQKHSDQICVHTTGHLLLIEKAGNVQTAVNECKNLPSQYQYECLSGTFMEDLFHRNLITHGIGKPMAWDEKTFAKQQEVCETYTSIPAKACWRELSHMILSLAKKDLATISRLCLLASNELSQKACQTHAMDTLSLQEKPSHAIMH